MTNMVGVLIAATYRRMMGVFVWLLVFVLSLVTIGGYSLHRTDEIMKLESRQATDQFASASASVVDTLASMHVRLTAEPCTEAFFDQWRKIAYQARGISEFLYAPGGRIMCSASVADLSEPVELGAPDLGPVGEMNIKLWIRRDLGFIGLPGETGSIALSDPHAAIVPPQSIELDTPDWLAVELVTVAANGDWWHRSGQEGTYTVASAAANAGGWINLNRGLSSIHCDAAGIQCVAFAVDVPALIVSETAGVVAGLLLAALLAWWVTVMTNRIIERRWSLDARFVRNLNDSSIVCHYQPLMAVESGAIVGCEVLARWRDVDGSLTSPDRFLGIVERQGLTLRFTELVARRALMELSGHIPAGTRLQVNFNIFPRDLDSARLARVYSGFISARDRFELVLEIIESDEIPASAQAEIEALRRLGVRTYIDDFGSGFANMQNLAALSVDGVKLDRAFAMAPDNSLMARMLRHAVEMIQATGRVTVVEGVETAERLTMLRRMQAKVDLAQGYFISPPLDIAGFAAFLGLEPVLQETPEKTENRAVA